jgi:hypothetical protein
MESQHVNEAVTARTPEDASYFFGFHDVSPWSPDDRRIVLHRFEGDLASLPGAGDVAQVMLWDPAGAGLELLGETTTWNLQQGARAQWVPRRPATVAFNRRVDGRAGCELVDLSTGARRAFAMTIGAIAPDGRFALSPSYGRLARYWKAYGYRDLPDPPGLDVPAPADDGIWRLDLESGESRLLLPIATLPPDPRNAAQDAYRFVTHLSFNPSGTRIVFYDRHITADGALYSRFLSARPDGADVKVVADEKVSHFTWLDDETVLVWMRKSAIPISGMRRAGLLSNPLLKPLIRFVRARSGGLKSAFLNESFYLLDVTGAAPAVPFEPSLFKEDGHPMLSPDGTRIVIDTYPDRGGMIALMLYDRRTRRRLNLAGYHHGVSVSDGDLKCDFHPRWNRAGTEICGDVCTDGRRGVVVVDVARALAH